MTKKTFAITSVILIAAIYAYYWLEWGSLQSFVIAIDHNQELFGDLVLFYYPTAQNVFSTKLPVHGYFYSTFFAILISPFGNFPLPQAKLLWGITQVVLAGVLGVVSGGKKMELSRHNKILFILLFLTSFPLLHNFKWGQVSVLITLCVLAAMWLYMDEQHVLAGILLAFAVSIKYYPFIFIAYPLLKRDYRFLFAFGLSTLIFFCAIPSFALGPLEWVNFEMTVRKFITDAIFTLDVNSQYIGHFVMRAIPHAQAQERVLFATLQGLGGLVFLVNIGTIWKLQQKHVQDAVLLSTGLLFLSLPFIIQTSWPHYFVYLPFCQTVAFIQIAQNHKTGKMPNLAQALTFLSCMASSIFAFNSFTHWSDYSEKGMLFISNFLLLFAFHQILWGKYKNSNGGLQSGVA